jgi:signal transduction protein with GAF and PtsI domain
VKKVIFNHYHRIIHRRINVHKERITDIEKLWRRAMAKVVWEEIEQERSCQERSYLVAYSLGRAKLPGGWLVKAHQPDGEGLTFVPDPNHEWK